MHNVKLENSIIHGFMRKKKNNLNLSFVIPHRKY